MKFSLRFLKYGPGDYLSVPEQSRGQVGGGEHLSTVECIHIKHRIHHYF